MLERTEIVRLELMVICVIRTNHECAGVVPHGIVQILITVSYSLMHTHFELRRLP